MNENVCLPLRDLSKTKKIQYFPLIYVVFIHACAQVFPWNESVPEKVPFMFWCASPDGDSSDPRKVSGKDGQACFWFNNGCDISCEECDGYNKIIHPTSTYAMLQELIFLAKTSHIYHVDH